LAADFNNDGKEDALLGGYNGLGVEDQLAVYLGTGDAGLVPFDVLSDGNSEAGIAAIGDSNSDGQKDFVLTDSLDVWFFYGEGTGNFTSQGPVTINSCPNLEPLNIYCVGLGDLNGDGRTDVVAVGRCSTQGTISVLLHK
jgi:hypothetical protein